MHHIHNNNKGFIKLLIVIVVTIIILGYFRVDIQEVINSPHVQKNLQYAWDLTKQGYYFLKDFIFGLIPQPK